jgi:hypothetical protein
MPRKENNKKSMDKVIQWNKRKKERNSKKKQKWIWVGLESFVEPETGYWERIKND